MPVGWSHHGDGNWQFEMSVSMDNDRKITLKLSEQERLALVNSMASPPVKR